MIGSIRIVSDGTVGGTFVLTPSGEQIKGICEIEIEKIDAKTPLVTANIKFMGVELDLKFPQREGA